MKNFFLNNKVVAISLLLTTSYVGIASAHTQSGSLGTAVGATDLYQVSCDVGTAKLATQVLTQSASAAGLKISVRTHNGAKATNSTDPLNTDILYSPLVATPGTNGLFYVSIGKTGAGLGYYIIQFHCMSASNVHTETAAYLLQNQ